MPTTVYIDVTSTGDNITTWTTLDAAITANEGDIVTADEIHVYRIHDDFGGWLTHALDIDFTNYTTDATRYILVKAADGDECVYSESAGARLRFTSKHDNFSGAATTDLYIDGLTFKWDIGDPSDNGPDHVNCLKISNSMVISTRTTAGGALVVNNSNTTTSVDYHMENVLLVRYGHANHDVYKGRSYAPTNLKNVTAIGGSIDSGDYGNGNSVINCYNCIIYNTAGNTFVDEANGKPIVVDNCAFSDATGYGTNKMVSIASSVFADYAGGDYQPAAASTVYHNGIGARAFANSIEVRNEKFVLSGANYTAAGDSSNNRMVLIVVSIRDNSAGETVDSVTLGAQAGTALTASYGLVTKHFYTRIFYILEADIPAGANALTITTNTGSVQVNTAFVMTLFNVSQAVTPTFEDPPVTHNTLVTTPKSLTASYGANSGKFALGLCFNRAGDYDFSVDGTILNDNGWRLGDYDYLAPGQNDVFLRLMQIDSLADNSTQTGWTVDYSDSGTNSNGHPSVFTYALTFTDFSVPAANPEITINEAVIEPGGAITGSYANFDIGSAPTSPVVLTDGTSNLNVTVTVTPTNPDDGTGTFSGSVPTLPAGSGSYILFGSVTATLDDA